MRIAGGIAAGSACWSRNCFRTDSPKATRRSLHEVLAISTRRTIKMSSLDRPVWAALTHAPHLAEGGDLAKRFRRDVNLFASASDDSPASLAALSGLVCDDEFVFLLQVPAIRVPDGLEVVREAQGVQLLAARPIEPEVGEDTIVELGNADAAEMLALAKLTEPGPFLPRTHTMGR